nr:MAG: hypothetical protein [Microviridae sp.]
MNITKWAKKQYAKYTVKQELETVRLNGRDIQQDSSNLNGDYINQGVSGTPFRLVGSDEKGYALAMGKYRMTELAPTKEELLNKLLRADWDLTANMIMAIYDMKDEIRAVQELERKQVKHMY